MKTTGISLLVLLLFQTLWVQIAHSAISGTSASTDETSKQELIYKSRGWDKPIGYRTDRSLERYADVLPSEFEQALARLTPTDRWLDIGAGAGNAVMDYYTPFYDHIYWQDRKRRGAKAKSVAISIEDRRTAEWDKASKSLAPDQMRYLSGKRFREYSAEELGRFQVITDVWGGFSYTENLSRFVENVTSVLDINGSFYTLLQDIELERGPNQTPREGAFLTEIVNADNSGGNVCSWLKRVTCVEVTCEGKAGSPRILAFRVRKVCDAVTVPELTQTYFSAGVPPERRFRFKN